MIDKWYCEPSDFSDEELENLDPDELRNLGWSRLANRLEAAREERGGQE